MMVARGWEMGAGAVGDGKTQLLGLDSGWDWASTICHPLFTSVSVTKQLDVGATWAGGTSVCGHIVTRGVLDGSSIPE